MFCLCFLAWAQLPTRTKYINPNPVSLANPGFVSPRVGRLSQTRCSTSWATCCLRSSASPPPWRSPPPSTEERRETLQTHWSTFLRHQQNRDRLFGSLRRAGREFQSGSRQTQTPPLTRKPNMNCQRCSLTRLYNVFAAFSKTSGRRSCKWIWALDSLSFAKQRQELSPSLRGVALVTDFMTRWHQLPALAAISFCFGFFFSLCEAAVSGRWSHNAMQGRMSEPPPGEKA